MLDISAASSRRFTADSTFSNERGATSLRCSGRRVLVSFGSPRRQTMTFAEGAWRDSFLCVKSVLASETSSKKQTHIVSASSVSIAAGAPVVRATMPCRLRTSATMSAAQASSRPRPGMQKTDCPNWFVSMMAPLFLVASPCADASSPNSVTLGTSCAARSSMISETVW